MIKIRENVKGSQYFGEGNSTGWVSYLFTAFSWKQGPRHCSEQWGNHPQSDWPEEPEDRTSQQLEREGVRY